MLHLQKEGTAVMKLVAHVVEDQQIEFKAFGVLGSMDCSLTGSRRRGMLE